MHESVFRIEKKSVAKFIRHPVDPMSLAAGCMLASGLKDLALGFLYTYIAPRNSISSIRTTIYYILVLVRPSGLDYGNA